MVPGGGSSYVVVSIVVIVVVVNGSSSSSSSSIVAVVVAAVVVVVVATGNPNRAQKTAMASWAGSGATRTTASKTWPKAPGFGRGGGFRALGVRLQGFRGSGLGLRFSGCRV